jgi:recombination protein RecT
MGSTNLKIDLSSSNKAIIDVKKQLITGYDKALAVMLKKYGYTLEKFTITIVNALKKNPKLIECTKDSLLSAVLASAELGLDIDNPMGYCYMIPFRNNKSGNTEAKFIVGYKGVVELLYRSPRVKRVVSEIVYENDHFKYTTGSKIEIEHSPTITGKSGKRIGTYTIVTLDNDEQLIQWIRAEQIEKLKRWSGVPELYEEANDPMGNMWKKAGIKQVIKYTPKEQVPIIGTIQERDERILQINSDDDDLQLQASEEIMPEIEGDKKPFGGLLLNEE